MFDLFIQVIIHIVLIAGFLTGIYALKLVVTEDSLAASFYGCIMTIGGFIFYPHQFIIAGLLFIIWHNFKRKKTISA
ncbi:hypothetical protein [Enterococcus termitis]|uniref:Uncharacterized protein n=1 Tax=Enterococcus termitis TaxID=332950 RepID=A0A1E5H4U6_9ENTE|nr:hypothetical protein [Enterococcus termitis]OEG19997.1 hypothetical protein BCR25_14505 [Enterococcus termitis]